MLETLSAPPVNPDAPQLSTEQGCPPPLDLSSTQIQPIAHPAAASSPQEAAADHQDGGRTASVDLREESGPLLYLSESLQESVTSDEVARPDSGREANKQADAAGKCDSDVQEPVGGAEVEPASAQQPLEPRKDKLGMLRKLGLDPPPVAKLRPDDGPFVELDSPQLNPGRCSLSALQLGPKLAVTGPALTFSSIRPGGSEGALSPSRQSTCSREGRAHGAAQYHPQRHHPVGSGGAAPGGVDCHRQRQSRGACSNEARYGSVGDSCCAALKKMM